MTFYTTVAAVIVAFIIKWAWWLFYDFVCYKFFPGVVDFFRKLWYRV